MPLALLCETSQLETLILISLFVGTYSDVGENHAAKIEANKGIHLLSSSFSLWSIQPLLSATRPARQLRYHRPGLGGAQRHGGAHQGQD